MILGIVLLYEMVDAMEICSIGLGGSECTCFCF
jgi:hypothetical protein